MLRLTRIRIVDFRSRHQRLQDVGQHLCIRARRQSALLSAPQFSRRDHFHGLGDLPCVGHAADTAPDVENVSHVLLFCRDAACCVLVRAKRSKLRLYKAYFATACLSATNVSLHSLIILLIWAFKLSSRVFFSMMVRRRPGLVASTYS